MQIRFLPYQARKSNDIWPNGAKIAVLFHNSPEDWDWDSLTQPGHNGPVGQPSSEGRGKPDLNVQSSIEYGFRVGLPRIIDVVNDAKVPFTFFVGGKAAERAPDLIKEVARSGHPIVAHSYDQGTTIQSMNRDQQLTAVKSSSKILEEIVGRKPLGWISPGFQLTKSLVEILIEQNFSYLIGLQDDEVPYFIEEGQKRLVSVPWRAIGSVGDVYLFARQPKSVEEAQSYLKAVFQAYREFAQKTPLIFAYGSHPYISGRPDPSKTLKDFISYIQSFPDVWITDYSQISEWWTERFASSSDLRTVGFSYK